MSTKQVSTIQHQYSHGKELVKTKVKGILIDGKVPGVEPLTNAYVAHVTFMHGDADGYETEELIFNKDQGPLLIEFLQFCAACAIRYPNGKGGRGDYTDVPGYDKWVGDKEGDFDEEGNFIGPNPRLEYWPILEGEWFSSYDSVRVTFFDDRGLEHKVAILVDE